MPEDIDAKVSVRICNHMNQDHPASILAMAVSLWPKAERARMDKISLGSSTITAVAGNAGGAAPARLRTLRSEVQGVDGPAWPPRRRAVAAPPGRRASASARRGSDARRPSQAPAGSSCRGRSTLRSPTRPRRGRGWWKCTGA